MATTIKRGVRDQAARTLVAASERNSRDREGAVLSGQADRLARLDARLRGVNTRFRAALEKESGFAPFQAEYAALLQHRRPRRDGRQFASDVQAFFERHRESLMHAYRSAAIDVASLAAALRHDLSTLGAFDLVREDTGLIRVDFPVERAGEEPPDQTAFTLEAPYAEEADYLRATSQGLAFDQIGVASSEDGFINLASTVVGAGRAFRRAMVGDFITVPPGFTRLKVSGVVTLVEYDLLAVSGAGFAESSAHAVIELTDHAGETQEERLRIARVVAPVFWYRQRKGSGEFVVTKTFTVPSIPAGGAEFIVRAGAEISCGAGLYAGADAVVRGHVTRIAVDALP